MLELEWDDKKRSSNLIKHGLDFVDATLVYCAENKETFGSMHAGESRFIDYAAIENQTLALVYTYRQNRIRIISFRHAKKKERQLYESIRQSHRLLHP